MSRSANRNLQMMMVRKLRRLQQRRKSVDQGTVERTLGYSMALPNSHNQQRLEATERVSCQLGSSSRLAWTVKRTTWSNLKRVNSEISHVSKDVKQTYHQDQHICKWQNQEGAIQTGRSIQWVGEHDHYWSKEGYAQEVDDPFQSS
jgi:hypothetical protein